MIPDKNLQLASSMSFAGAVADTPVLAPDYIDLSLVRDIGEGTPLYIVVTVLESFTSGGSALLEFALSVFNDGATDPAFFQLGTSIPLAALQAQSNAQAAVTQTRGLQIVFPLPPLWNVPSSIATDPAVRRGWRYMTAVVTPRVANITAGKIAIDIATEFSDPLKCYRKSYTVI